MWLLGRLILANTKGFKLVWIHDSLPGYRDTVHHANTPYKKNTLHPLLYIQTGVYRGIHFFLNRTTDKRHCFCYTVRKIPLLSKFQKFNSLAIFSNCPVQFVPDLVGNPEARIFSLRRDSFCLSVTGCGASLLLIPMNVIITEEFTDRRTVAMGIASTGGSIGNIILPQFTLWCIGKYGRRGSFLLLGGLCLQGVVTGVLFYNGKKLRSKQTATILGASTITPLNV